MPVPNTEGAAKKSFEAKKAGWYRMQFITYEERTAKDGKSEYAHVQFDHEDESDGSAWVNFSYKPEALWKLDEFKRAIGMASHETRLEDYQGTWLEVFLKIEIYEGDKKNVPSKFRPLPDTAAPAAPTKPTRSDSNGSPAPDDDDLPF